MALFTRVCRIFMGSMFLIWAFCPRPSLAQATAPARATVPEKPASISLNGSVLTPGDVLQTLWGVAGPPDSVLAVRGKEAVNDYVKFAYTTYGISVHLKNDKNQNSIVDAIIVLQAGVKLVNVPFRVGDDYKSAMQVWGQPDRQEPGFMAYWKRGVYVGVAEDGRILHITLALPGRFDEEANPPQQHGMSPAGTPVAGRSAAAPPAADF